ncbi:MAG: AsnC family transcriptional regulator [Candidatus Bathyarchaeia archaeon]
MDEIDRKILFEMKRGIPLVTEPFKEIATRLRITQKEVISRLIKLRERGVIRRFGASIEPRRIGLSANAMVVWKVPESRVEEVGTFLSKFKEVTHCCERKTIPRKWEYNLYTVMHAQERETIEMLVKKFSDTIAISDYLVLFSKRKLKKTSAATTSRSNAQGSSRFGLRAFKS